MGIENAPAETGALDLLREAFPEDVLELARPQGDEVAVIRPEALPKVVDLLKSDPRLDFAVLVDVTAVDYFGRKPRFDVVYHLLSLTQRRRLRLKLRIDEGIEVPSLAGVWGCADWLEREVWDMFGIRFAGHPNLRRILMYEGFQGHPLRKDYPVNKRQPLIGPKN